MNTGRRAAMKGAKKYAVMFVRIMFALLCACVIPLSTAGEAVAEEDANELQRLVDKARPGETVEVPAGVYEGPLVISKPITLRASPAGEVRIVHAPDGSDEPAIRIESGHMTLTGFTIEDGRMKQSPSVLVDSSDRVTMDNLTIRTGSIGIAIRGSNDVTVRDSRVEWGAAQARPTAKGNGIDLFQAHRAHIVGNTVIGMHDAIYVEFSDDARIENNVVERSRYGIHTMYSERPVILSNTGIMNVTGAMVMTSRGALVDGNRFAKQTENVHSQGILLFDAHESVLSDNEVEGNRVGLYVEQSTDNVIEHNRIRSNFIGIQLLDARENRFRHNVLTGNVADAQAIRSTDNEFQRNFWDSFQGIDVNGDGVSELAHSINPFFLGLVEKRPSFQLLFQSPGMVFLEGLFQSDRASWTTDAEPLMTVEDNDGSTSPDGTSGRGGLLHPTGLAGLALLAASAFVLVAMRRTI